MSLAMKSAYGNSNHARITENFYPKENPRTRRHFVSSTLEDRQDSDIGGLPLLKRNSRFVNQLIDNEFDKQVPKEIDTSQI